MPCSQEKASRWFASTLSMPTMSWKLLNIKNMAGGDQSAVCWFMEKASAFAASINSTGSTLRAPAMRASTSMEGLRISRSRRSRFKFKPMGLQMSIAVDEADQPLLRGYRFCFSAASTTPLIQTRSSSFSPANRMLSAEKIGLRLFVEGNSVVNSSAGSIRSASANLSMRGNLAPVAPVSILEIISTLTEAAAAS